MAKSFGAITNTLIMEAEHKKKLRRDLLMKEKVLLAMKDGKWHSGYELSQISWRFGGYLFNLKEQGVKWEKRLMPERPKGAMLFEYRLIEKEQ